MGKITLNQDSLKTSREYKRHKVDAGSNVYRILPPFGDLETHNNHVFRRWAVAWLINPSTGKRTPFSTPLTLDGKGACPVQEYSEQLKDAIETKKSTLKAKGVSASRIKEELKGLHEVQWNIRVAYTYAYNACDKSGNVGILELKSTAHKAMKLMLQEYITEFGQDPTSLNSDLRDDAGVWFNIKKEGEKKDTKYSVEFNNQKVRDRETGEVSLKLDRSPLPDAVVEGYDKLGYDLFSLYKQKSYDELKDILLFNLALISQEIPEAILPGYEDALSLKTGKSAVKKSAAKVEEEDEEYEDEVVEEKPKKKSNVKIQLGSDEDDNEILSSDDDDIKSFADSILED